LHYKLIRDQPLAGIGGSNNGSLRVVDGGVTLQGPGRDFASLSPNSGSGQKAKYSLRANYKLRLLWPR